MIERVDQFITKFRERYSSSLYEYRNGGCFDFYKILKKEFPEAQAWYNGDHVITLIGGRFWDIGGCVLYPLESEPRIFKDADSWSKSLIKQKYGRRTNIEKNHQKG